MWQYFILLYMSQSKLISRKHIKVTKLSRRPRSEINSTRIKSNTRFRNKVESFSFFLWIYNQKSFRECSFFRLSQRKEFFLSNLKSRRYISLSSRLFGLLAFVFLRWFSARSRESRGVFTNVYHNKSLRRQFYDIKIKSSALSWVWRQQAAHPSALFTPPAHRLYNKRRSA